MPYTAHTQFSNAITLKDIRRATFGILLSQFAAMKHTEVLESNKKTKEYEKAGKPADLNSQVML